MPRLTLISDTTDRELAAIRRAVTAFDSVGDEPGVIDVLRRHVDAGTRADTLDFVGHSGAHGFLRVGYWVFDDSRQTAGSFDVLVRPLLEALGVSDVRLLGCSTARSARGWAAITQIARASRSCVHGTRRYIGVQDYRASGFISDDALVATPNTRPERQDWIGFLPHAAMPIPIHTLAMSAGPPLSSDQPLLPVNEAVASALVECVDGSRSWVVPGLLAHPCPIVLWSHANTIHRLEILFDGQAVRAYGTHPDDEHGRIYRVHDPTRLNHLLEQRDH